MTRSLKSKTDCCLISCVLKQGTPQVAAFHLHVLAGSTPKRVPQKANTNKQTNTHTSKARGSSMINGQYNWWSVWKILGKADPASPPRKVSNTTGLGTPNWVPTVCNIFRSHEELVVCSPTIIDYREKGTLILSKLSTGGPSMYLYIHIDGFIRSACSGVPEGPYHGRLPGSLSLLAI